MVALKVVQTHHAGVLDRRNASRQGTTDRGEQLEQFRLYCYWKQGSKSGAVFMRVLGPSRSSPVLAPSLSNKLPERIAVRHPAGGPCALALKFFPLPFI